MRILTSETIENETKKFLSILYNKLMKLKATKALKSGIWMNKEEQVKVNQALIRKTEKLMVDLGDSLDIDHIIKTKNGLTKVKFFKRTMVESCRDKAKQANQNIMARLTLANAEELIASSQVAEIEFWPQDKEL